MRPVKELWMTFRVVPVLQWTFTNSIIVLASTFYIMGKADIVSWFMASVVAWATQGFLSHVVNDIYDWIHGTDRLVDIDKTITGGSHTVHKYYTENVFAHAKNILPWAIISLVSTYYFIHIMHWLHYVACGATLAVVVGVFYSAPPVKADHRPFIGEWVVAFGGLMSCNALLYYAAAHTISLELITASFPYVITNMILLKMHHVNDIFPDLNAEVVKYTSISWLYEKYGIKAVSRYLVALLSVLLFVSLITSLSVISAVVFIPLAIYGYRLVKAYSGLDFNAYPFYLGTTVPVEIKWIISSIVTGLVYAVLNITLLFLT